MTHWYLTMWPDRNAWHYRIEKGEERIPVSIGLGHPGVPRDMFVEMMFSEWSRLVHAGS